MTTVDLTDYEVGDFTSYYTWCTVKDCPWVSPDRESEDTAVADAIEHLEEDHS